jgi:hypothetical protein
MEDSHTHPLVFVFAVIAVWFMFMILPLAAATLTISIQSNTLWVIYGLWALSVLVCLGLIVRLKK